MTGWGGPVRALALCLLLAACAEPQRSLPAPLKVTPPRPTTAAPPPAPPSPSLLESARPSFPPPGALSVCTDAPLVLELDVDAVAGSSGRIRVFDVSAPERPADTIDLGAPAFTDVIGGRALFVPNPVLVEGRRVHVRLRSRALRPDRTYAVTIEDGVLLGADGRSLGALDDAAAWRFTTRAAKPASPNELRVALDGTGDFCSVQGALDFVPAGNTEPVVISIARGTYRELVFVENKHSLTLRGDERAGTVIAYTNNDELQDGQGARVRALAAFENVNDLVIENLTFHNTTPQGGSQAEALRVDPGERVIVRNASFLSRQDTLLLSGRVYVRDSYVEGNVDYVWGTGTAYFERVELKTVGRPGWTVQARNPAGAFGYVFVDCTLTAGDGVTGHLLARIDATRFPASHVAWIGCRMSPAIEPRGWEITPPGNRAPQVRFFEYGSRDLDGRPLDLSKRHPASKRLDAARAAKLRDKRHVLGGWQPEQGKSSPSEADRASP